MKTIEPFPDKMTIGEKYRPAMEITDQAEADAYFEECVQHDLRRCPEMPRETAEKIEKENLGYFAGYYDIETVRRVSRLFETTHPIFGIMIPSAQEAFIAGRERAQ